MSSRPSTTPSTRRFPGPPRRNALGDATPEAAVRDLSQPADSSNALADDPRSQRSQQVGRWLTEQRLAADVRSLLGQLDPNRAEAWRRWREHRTRTADLSVTVSWAETFAAGDDGQFVVPHLAAVIESLLVGAATAQDDLTVEEECGLYRSVVEELSRRIDAMQESYD